MRTSRSQAVLHEMLGKRTSNDVVADLRASAQDSKASMDETICSILMDDDAALFTSFTPGVEGTHMDWPEP